MSIEISVSYFAAARELCGCAGEPLSLADAAPTGADVLEAIAARHPAIAPFLSRMRLAINGELVDAATALAPGDEVAILPPVAGGSAVALCEVRSTPLSVDETLAAVSHEGAGGIALFVGTVRDHADGLPVARLDYEAHPTLARSEMARVLDEVAAAHPGVRVAALHREGQLAVGDLAVVVAASSAHRAEAFAACREAIERIKERVPIWKKEWAPDGSAHWVNL